MTQVTPIYSWPYPENTDPPNGPAQIQAAVTAIENTVNSNLSGKQPVDATLTGLAAMDNVLGLVTENAIDGFVKRAVVSTDASMVIGNPNGTAGNVDLAVAQANLRVAGTVVVVAPHTLVVNQCRRYLGNLVMADLRVTTGAAITVTAATGSTTNTAVCTLPVGFRPSSTLVWSGFQDNNSVPCSGVILNTGNIEIRATNPGCTLPSGTNVFIEAVFNIA